MGQRGSLLGIFTAFVAVGCHHTLLPCFCLFQRGSFWGSHGFYLFQRVTSGVHKGTGIAPHSQAGDDGNLEKGNCAYDMAGIWEVLVK